MSKYTAKDVEQWRKLVAKEYKKKTGRSLESLEERGSDVKFSNFLADFLPKLMHFFGEFCSQLGVSFNEVLARASAAYRGEIVHGSSLEVRVTHLMNRWEDMKYYAGSNAEYGGEAGPVTWANALDNFDDDNLDREPYLVETAEGLEIVRDYFRDMGAWGSAEIRSWGVRELNALLLQFIAGDIRGYKAAEKAGTIPQYEEREGGRLYRGDDDEWYYYVGN